MSKTRVSNIKIPSRTLEQLKRLTGESTGQKAVERALLFFLKEARQRDLLNFLSTPRFRDDFDILEQRSRDR